MPQMDYPNDNYADETRSFRVVGAVIDALAFLFIWGVLLFLAYLRSRGMLS